MSRGSGRVLMCIRKLHYFSIIHTTAKSIEKDAALQHRQNLRGHLRPWLPPGRVRKPRANERPSAATRKVYGARSIHLLQPLRLL